MKSIYFSKFIFFCEQNIKIKSVNVFTYIQIIYYSHIDLQNYYDENFVVFFRSINHLNFKNIKRWNSIKFPKYIFAVKRKYAIFSICLNHKAYVIILNIILCVVKNQKLKIEKINRFVYYAKILSGIRVSYDTTFCIYIHPSIQYIGFTQLCIRSHSSWYIQKIGI